MAGPSVSWDETSPAGGDQISQGDDRIREAKTQIREIIDEDHQFNSSGSDADNGFHKQVTLLAPIATPTASADHAHLYTKDVAAKAELHFQDEDSNEIQITTGGKIRSESLNGVYPATLAQVVNILPFIYPVGSIYVNASVATNPGTLFGFGTWTAFGSGRVMVGLNSGDTDFDTVEETGGAKTHTLSESEMPQHGHPFRHSHNTGGGSDASGGLMTDLGGTPTSHAAYAGVVSDSDGQQIGGTGGGAAHNNLQPYIVVYMWKRTA